MTEHLECLDPVQRVAATVATAALVLAGAGSGKTAMLIRRVADLILVAKRRTSCWSCRA